MLKDFKNAALFSVVHLGIDMAFEAARNKEVGTDSQYALSATIEYTQWMSKLDNADDKTARKLQALTSIQEEDEVDETEPIYLNVLQKKPRFFEQDDEEEEDKKEVMVDIPVNITLGSIDI